MGYKVKLLIADNQEKTDEEILANNPCLSDKLITNSRSKELEGYCHNYALNKYNTLYLNDNFDYLVRNYKTIPISKATEGDIIVFYDNPNAWGTPQHFSKIWETNGTIKGTIIRSKWGMLGVYETDLYHLPEEYGCYMEVWTKKE